ncbi:hypothetical protein [Antarcticirhabdus aurantiaca]|uniref:Uncharacterized protein n=1 Tax=Antarcticirhabdus aurantiaca TaxID=2606717 RepID=A0ACD4NRD7_9HYPH|nr:hypothetical protein [Antarcticirhabdus aurantiaca]WAJ29515.1 hypothetical protein OXU80_04575 [Jeongeuplla avenae]
MINPTHSTGMSPLFGEAVSYLLAKGIHVLPRQLDGGAVCDLFGAVSATGLTRSQVYEIAHGLGWTASRRP